MPATSARCLRSPERRALRGFTLLELLVVLLLIGMVAGLVTPAVQRQLAAADERAWVRQVDTLLGGLPLQAFQGGQPLSLDAAALLARLPGLPPGTRIDLPAALQYGPTGVASGGRVDMTPPGRDTLRWAIRPVTGESQRQ